jgi:predicted dehydrogenase
MKKGPVRIGIVGSQFQAECHATSIAMIEGDMTVVAVASPTQGNAQRLADRFKIIPTIGSWPPIPISRLSPSLLLTRSIAR